MATSLGCPGRPIGVPLNSSSAAVVIVAGIRGVQTIPRLAVAEIFLWEIRFTWPRTHAIHPNAVFDLLVG